MSDTSIEEIRESATVNLVNNMQPKVFKTGKKGFYAQGKITIGGKRYQSQIMMVEIADKK